MAQPRRTWLRGALASALAVLVAIPATATPSMAGGSDHGSAKLRRAVTAKGLFTHLKALQWIADHSGGTRASGTVGYDRSAAYAEKVFRAAGYRVTTQEFQFQTFVNNAPSVLQRVAPSPADLPNDVMSYSGSGDVTAAATVPTGSELGCAATDFGAANAGTVVVVSRGTCAFGVKATNAVAAGAAGIVIYNNTAGALQGTLGNTFTEDIAAVGVTQELGQELVAQVPAGLTLHLATDTTREMATTRNVFAESRRGDPTNVVMAGAHLDSVSEGPGINDNGSGTAAVLEVAKQMAKFRPKNKLRFALWGAEEASLVGSNYYIANLPQTEREKIALYLNFDMVGSPNYVRFVYDGDNSAFPPGPGSAVGPPGSAAIEALFHEYFASQGLASAESPFSGRSDYGPFIATGVEIPAGGLFTGAEGVKTEEQAAVYGGTAGVAYDICYHEACDTIANVNARAIDQMSDAVAHAVFTYARDTSSVTGS